MNRENALTEWYHFGLTQTKNYVEILRLKLRIIGFSNKRQGLFARLGEAAGNAITDGRNVADDELVIKLMATITEAGREIGSAESDIVAMRERSAVHRKSFRHRRAERTPDESDALIPIANDPAPADDQSEESPPRSEAGGV